jgi:hypothetical protein
LRQALAKTQDAAEKQTAADNGDKEMQDEIAKDLVIANEQKAE